MTVRKNNSLFKCVVFFHYYILFIYIQFHYLQWLEDHMVNYLLFLAGLRSWATLQRSLKSHVWNCRFFTAHCTADFSPVTLLFTLKLWKNIDLKMFEIIYNFQKHLWIYYCGKIHNIWSAGNIFPKWVIPIYLTMF